MNKKRIFIIFLLLIFSTSFVFSASTMAKAADVDFKAMDVPLLEGMGYFIRTMDTFASIAGTLAVALFLVTICWNAFRLWFGTQQIRKAAVDIMLKCLLFTALVCCYRGIQMGVITTSMKIGSLAGGGLNDLSIAFTDLANTLEKEVKAADEMFEKLMNSAEKNGAAFTDKDVENLMKGFGRTEEEMNEILASKGITVWNSVGTEMKEDYSGKGIWGFIRANSIVGMADTAKYGIMGIQNKKFYNKMYKDMEKSEVAKAKEMIKKGSGGKIITLMHAMRNVFEEIEEEDPYEGIDWSNEANTYEFYQARQNASKTNIKKYLYSPFIRSGSFSESSSFKIEDLKNLGLDNVMISPGAMIKTSVLIANLLFEYNSLDYNDGNAVTKTFKGINWQNIFNYILLIVMSLTLVFSSIFCVIQYVMCIFEYFITTSIGILFVPCILFDGTKSFASKLITLFTSYFIKIMVTILCLFWVFSTYLRVGMNVATSMDGASLMTFSYLMFTVLLGFIVTQNAPQIAVTVLNGSPQLSMGEFLHAAGTVAAGAALANKAGKAAVATTQKVAKPIDGAVSGIAAAGAVAAGTMAGGGTKGHAFKKGLKTLGSAWGSGIVNSASRLVLGRDVAQTRSDTLGFKKGSAQTIHSNKVQSGEWKAEEAAKYGMLAGQDGKNTLGSIREAAKLDAVAEQRKKNPPPNDKNANGEGGSGGYNNPPKDTTEKVEDTRQS